MLELLLILIAIYLFVYITRRIAQKNGEAGENIVSNELSKLSGEYFVYNDVKMCGYQIDHIVIHHMSKSVFVIETKMWGGKIVGNYRDKKWIQYKDGNVKFLNNPMIQNSKHCNVVRQKYKGYSIYNVVVFVGNRNIPKYKSVINEDNLINYISNKVSNRGKIDMQSDWLSLLKKI